MKRVNLYESFGYKNPKLNVGDTIKVLSTKYSPKSLIGSKGVVEEIVESEKNLSVLVRFNNNKSTNTKLVLEIINNVTQDRVNCDLVKVCGDLGEYSIDDYSDFVEYAETKLDLKNPVKVKVENQPSSNYTTSNYNRINREIKVRNNGRKLVDIIRSIAHEMVHHKQDEMGKITGKVPKIGGHIEDEANKISGRLVKDYGMNNSNIYE